jgi:hypothetical protein
MMTLFNLGLPVAASGLLCPLDVHFIETSSLTGDNIEKPFALAARAILLSIESGQLDTEKASGYCITSDLHTCTSQTHLQNPLTRLCSVQLRLVRASRTAAANFGESLLGVGSRSQWARCNQELVVAGLESDGRIEEERKVSLI